VVELDNPLVDFKNQTWKAIVGPLESGVSPNNPERP
jgi:hypothetical protein